MENLHSPEAAASCRDLFFQKIQSNPPVPPLDSAHFRGSLWSRLGRATLAACKESALSLLACAIAAIFSTTLLWPLIGITGSFLLMRLVVHITRAVAPRYFNRPPSKLYRVALATSLVAIGLSFLHPLAGLIAGSLHGLYFGFVIPCE